MPQASYSIRVHCGQCGHQADMRVGIDVIQNLYRLSCGVCGAKGKHLAIQRLSDTESAD